MPEMLEKMQAVYDRELSKIKSKRKKRKEWKADFTTKLDVTLQPPIEGSPEARIITQPTPVNPPEVTFYLDTSDEWEEMGYLTIRDQGDDEYVPIFVDRVPGEDVDYDVPQEWPLGEVFGSFQEAVEYVVTMMENGDERQQRMAKVISYLADELTKRIGDQ